ncbi:hypothetical protein Q0590_22905 [Rhodocytophaga aerolata]|uniref:DUF3316 domain-containing protein n=1 Tax=Rhodocytophaga aerolata TaxID=455078 RepID=A0ABT8RAR0_9BACT|nr:hypothetical protein [Rhodocytophaga aerolata]MDO1449145.1 hypothetical protein [Rhodocytophaga aerolata]
MFKHVTTILTLVVGMQALCCMGQENPLGALPMEYNPAFAGQMSSFRISSASGYTFDRGFTTHSQEHFVRSSLSYDQFIPALRTGIGLTAGSGWNQSGYSFNIRSQGLSLSIAPKFSIEGKYTVSPALEIGYGQTNSMWPRYRIDRDSSFDKLVGKAYGISSKAGLLFNSNKLYLGYAVSLFRHTTGSRLLIPARGFNSYLQAGYTFQRSAQSAFSFTPQLVIQISRLSHQPKVHVGVEAYNFTFRYKHVIWGINNAGIHVGWQTEKLRLMLSNDAGVFNRNGADTMYSGNLSFRYVFSRKNQIPGRGW